MLISAINVSEGRRPEAVRTIVDAAEPDVLDVHSDPWHHRSVVTVVGEEAPRRLATVAARVLDLREHTGVHPRIGVVDVVPFTAFGDSTAADARLARDTFAAWAASTLGVPCFVYGPERDLPAIRRHAFRMLTPDHGPAQPHPTAGAIAVGARPPLVAYNLWLASEDLALAQQIARELRGSHVRALGLPVGESVQISLNLVEPAVFDPAMAFDAVAVRAPIARAELVGLVPRAVLARIDPARWESLDLSDERTVEARLAGWRAGPTS